MLFHVTFWSILNSLVICELVKYKWISDYGCRKRDIEHFRKESVWWLKRIDLFNKVFLRISKLFSFTFFSFQLLTSEKINAPNSASSSLSGAHINFVIASFLGGKVPIQCIMLYKWDSYKCHIMHIYFQPTSGSLLLP